MSKWDSKFAQANEPGPVATVLRENQHLLPTTGTALDLACGLGANALFLSQHGLITSAWDNSATALAKLNQFASANQLTVQTQKIDLEQPIVNHETFDVICICHFLYRPLCEFIYRALKPNGLLFYQTFTLQKSSTDGPNNPDFLLKKNELLQLFSHLSPVCYREERDCGNTDLGFRNLAYLIARKE